MTTVERHAPVQTGEPAPDFTLPAADREGTVSLADYRGRSPVLVALFRGLYWGFCRRHVAQLGGTRRKLLAAGVDALAVMATDPARARFYFRFHPPPVPVAADPELVTHRLYGLPNPAVVPVTPELLEAYRTTYINPMGDLPRPMPVLEASAETNRIDGHELTATDHEEKQRHLPLAVGQFLVDRAGIVRWANVEGAEEGLAGAGKFPRDDELLAAARALPTWERGSRRSSATEGGMDKAAMRQTETTLPAPPAVGQPAPDFRLDSIRGRPMRLADFRGRRVILWLSRGIYWALCRLALSQLRHGYPEIRERNAELIEVGPNVPTSAVRAFRQYLGGRELEFPYLCDPDWTVHTRYGLRPVGPDKPLAHPDSSILEQIARLPAVTPTRAETRRLRANPMQQGLFIIDEGGVVRYAYITTPTGPLPPIAALLAVLDSSTG